MAFHSHPWYEAMTWAFPLWDGVAEGHLQSFTEQSQDALIIWSGKSLVARHETASSCASKAPSGRPCCIAYTCRYPRSPQ